MSTLVAYIAIFIGAGIFGIANGAPLNPLQILWLNMVVDIPLAIALGFDQPARGLMGRPPRPVGAPVLSRNNWIRLCVQGAVMTIGSLVAYQIGDDQDGAVVAATMLLTTLSVFHLFAALLCRDQTQHHLRPRHRSRASCSCGATPSRCSPSSRSPRWASSSGSSTPPH